MVSGMARLARIVVPDCPHHVTARGNRREPIFFEDGDQDIYCDLLGEQMRNEEYGDRSNVSFMFRLCHGFRQGSPCPHRRP